MKEGEATWFKARYLFPRYKFWHTFITSRLNPTKHESEVYVDKALLLYALVKGLSIDVGKVIVPHARWTIWRRGEALPFLSIISDLCLRQQCRYKADEEQFMSRSLINFKNFVKEGKSKLTQDALASSSRATPP